MIIKKNSELESTFGWLRTNLSSKQMDWIAMLCKFDIKDEEKANFLNIYNNSPSVEIAIMSYRRYLYLTYMRDISEEIIMDAYISHNYERLHCLLQELFLEPITKHDIKNILSLLDKNEQNLNVLYQAHLDNNNIRLKKALLIIKFS